MDTVFLLLTVQILMGAFDNLWHHEITERLPSKRGARRELALHSTREFLYAVIFAALAWYELHGPWAIGLAMLLMVEIAVTIADFLEEDASRRLPPLERVLHTLLAINVGALLAVLSPLLWQWSLMPAALVPVDHGVWSWILAFAAVGILAWSVRDFVAVTRLMRPPYWQIYPIAHVGRKDVGTALITGATGFIGTQVTRMFLRHGYRVVVLTRDPLKAVERFGPAVKVVEAVGDIESDGDIDVIVNLAGAPIASWWWTTRRKLALVESRLAVTRSLLGLIERLRRKPGVLISASAIGYYGVRDLEHCVEESPAGDDFPARLCRLWERLASRAQRHGVRVCRMRFGIVLGREGGVLPRLSLGVRFGAGAIMGSGRQWVSWIHVDDAARLILFAASNESLRGPVNATAPQALRHRDFMRAMASAMGRPVWLRVPAGVLRALAGEMATLFVDGQRVWPAKATAGGFRFKYPKAAGAFDALFQPRASLDVTRAEVFYNGACPMCAWQAGHYARLAADGHVSLVDVSREPDALRRYGIDASGIGRRLHVRDADGRVQVGVDAFSTVWFLLPGYRWLARLVQFPVFHGLANMLYEGLLTPTRVRYNARQMARRAS